MLLSAVLAPFVERRDSSSLCLCRRSIEKITWLRSFFGLSLLSVHCISGNSVHRVMRFSNSYSSLSLLITLSEVAATSFCP